MEIQSTTQHPLSCHSRGDDAPQSRSFPGLAVLRNRGERRERRGWTPRHGGSVFIAE